MVLANKGIWIRTGTLDSKGDVRFLDLNLDLNLNLDLDPNLDL